MITEEVWESLQELALEYPLKPLALGASRCHWFPAAKRNAMCSVIECLPDDMLYLELGSFLGAGSTATVLRARPQARLICIDHWLIQGDYAARHDLLDVNAPGTDQPCAFVRKRGEAWEHFLNNTFEDRHRVLPIRRSYSGDLMYALHDKHVCPNLILLDDDHREQPLVERLRLIRELWPKAHLLIDDFDDKAVKKGFYRAVDEYLCPLEDCELLADCLMWVKPYHTVF